MIKETITDPEQQMRVFSDTDCTENLKVWYVDGNDMSNTDGIREFRLTYDVLRDAHGVLWRKKVVDGQAREIYAHVGIDDGESRTVSDPDGHVLKIPVKRAASPVLNGVFEESDALRLADDFMQRAKNIDQVVARFVYEKLLAFPEKQFVHKPHE